MAVVTICEPYTTYYETRVDFVILTGRFILYYQKSGILSIYSRLNNTTANMPH